MEKLISLLERNGKGKIVLKDSLSLFEVHQAIHEGRAYIDENGFGFVYIENDEQKENKLFSKFKQKCIDSCKSLGNAQFHYGTISITAENAGKEIEDGTKFGLNLLDDFMQLTFDLMNRKKIDKEEVKKTYLLIYSVYNTTGGFHSTFPGYSHCQSVEDMMMDLDEFVNIDLKKDKVIFEDVKICISIIKYYSNDDESYYSNNIEVSAERLSNFLKKRLKK